MVLAKKIPGAWIGLKIAALLLLLEGQRAGWIVEVLGLTRMSLNRWLHGVNTQGLRSLVPRPRPGRPSGLTTAIRATLARHLDQSPQAFGLSRFQCDGPTLAVHLKRHFAIALQVRQAQLWLHQLAYRLKRTGYSYLQARAEEARRFQRRLKKLRVLGPNETVVFQDETGFTLHPRLGRTWGKQGQRVRVPTTSQHRTRLNLSGWVAPLLGRAGVVRIPRGVRAGFLHVLRHLSRRLRWYTIWCYVDGAGWHRGPEVDEFLRTHRRLWLEYLPRYQPALDPQERVWRRIGYEATTNRCFPDLEAIWEIVQATRHSWSPQKIKRYVTSDNAFVLVPPVLRARANPPSSYRCRTLAMPVEGTSFG